MAKKKKVYKDINDIMQDDKIEFDTTVELNLLQLTRKDLQKRYFYRFFKRSFDIIFSLTVLIIMSLPMSIIAVCIKCTDGGSVFFKQDRVGGHGEIFKMIKFRSMCVDAEQKLEELKDLNEAQGLLFKMKNDPRVTKIGKFIRKTSLDEFPQFFNVLTGHMSVVGPRPPLVSEVKLYNLYQKQRLIVNPGITCYWQVSGRSNIGFNEMVKLDIQYIKERGLWTDFKVICKTIPAVLSHKGAE